MEAGAGGSRSLSRQYADVGRKGARSLGKSGYFSIAFVRHRSQFMLLGLGLVGCVVGGRAGARQ